MIKIDIPSYKKIEIENVVFDYNGTLAVDGRLIDGIKEKLIEASKAVNVYVVTADTYGTVRENFKDVELNVKVISQENGTLDKVSFIRELGKDKTIAIGNGNNDELMIKESAIGVCILGDEGLATRSLIASDIVLKDINDFFDMIMNKKRIIANLRK
ncbi:ATPase P [Wukongibacter baidiensis]|uniref:HAD family hydrolase n=1 Tax=Wukongibacter baidiensis TaxID=1723361 RepID=UPI003D7FD3DB